MKKFLFVIFVLSVNLILFAGCGSDDSPELALSEMKIALTERNFEKLSQRIDLEKFFAQTYDDVTVELVKNCAEYGKKYPEDPYFQHDADFLQKYNSDHRELHLNFLRGVKDAYFKKLPEPETPELNPHAYIANEFEKILQASTATVTETKIIDNHATLTVEMQGDNSIRGSFIGKLIFKLGFEKNDKGSWQLTKIENLDELTPPLVDKAEQIWITFF